MPDKCMSSRSGGLRPVPDAEPDRTRRSQGAGTSQKPAPAPASDGGLLRVSSSSSLLRPLEPRRVPAHGVTGHHEGPACISAIPTATHVPSPSARSTISATVSRPTPRAAYTIASALNSHQPVGVRALLPPDEDVPFLVRHVDPHEAVLMRDASADANQESRSSRPRIPFCLIPAISLPSLCAAMSRFNLASRIRITFHRCPRRARQPKAFLFRVRAK